MDKVELRLVGITYNQIESGVYALLLEDRHTLRRLAIVIGYPEAQSIECHLQNIKTPRPLAHDVMVSLLESLNAHLAYIFIHKLPAGPYAASLHVIDEIGREVVVDSRSSDAIALAIRLKAPIFTSRELMETEGFTPDDKKAISPIAASRQAVKNRQEAQIAGNTIESMSVDSLKQYIDECVKAEKYEEAAVAKRELEKRGILPDINID